jgi:hypothetical protein
MDFVEAAVRACCLRGAAWAVVADGEAATWMCRVAASFLANHQTAYCTRLAALRVLVALARAAALCGPHGRAVPCLVVLLGLSASDSCVHILGCPRS